MKKLIRFGEVYHWAPRLLDCLDTSQFRYEFGPSDDERLTELDAYVPLSITDIQALFELSEPAQSKALFPGNEVLDLAANKIRFYDYLATHGFGAHVPQRLQTPAQYPIVAKTEFSDNSENVWILHNAAERAALLARHGPQSVVLTEYIPGSREYALHFLARHGQVLRLQGSGRDGQDI